MIEIQELMVHMRFVDSVNPISSKRKHGTTCQFLYSYKKIETRTHGY
jgi:hypothetical protein